MKGNRRFRKSERKAVARVISVLLRRELSVDKIETSPEITLRRGLFLVTGRDKVILTVREK